MQTQPLNNLAIIAYQRGDTVAARRLLGENVDLYAAVGDSKGVAITLTNQAGLAYTDGEDAVAISLSERAIPLCEQIGDRWMWSNGMAGLGYALARIGRFDAAQQALRKSLNAANDINVEPLVLYAIIGLAMLRRLRGEAEESAKLLAVVLSQPELSHENRKRSTQEADALRDCGVNVAEIAARPLVVTVQRLVNNANLIRHCDWRQSI